MECHKGLLHVVQVSLVFDQYCRSIFGGKIYRHNKPQAIVHRVWMRNDTFWEVLLGTS